MIKEIVRKGFIYSEILFCLCFDSNHKNPSIKQWQSMSLLFQFTDLFQKFYNFFSLEFVFE